MKISDYLIGLAKVAISVTIGILASSHIQNSNQYMIPKSNESVQKERTLKFMEVFSSGNPLAIEYLNRFSTPNVMRNITSLVGDSHKGQPYPFIESMYYGSEDTIIVEFDPMVKEYEQQYEYLFEYDNQNRLANLKMTYVYRGKLRGEGK